LDGTCWGYLVLLRAVEQPDFTKAETQAVRSAIPHLAANLRAELLAKSAERTDQPEPGVAIVRNDGSLEAANSPAQGMFEQISSLRRGVVLEIQVPVEVIAAGLRSSDPPDTRRVLLAGPDGGWLAVTASRVIGENTDSRVVVTMEPAKPMVIAPLLLQQFGLTE